MFFRRFFLFGFPVSILAIRTMIVFGISPLELASLSPLSCPIRQFFGIYCPTCGLTRSLLLSMAGEYKIAHLYHFMGNILFFLSILVWIYFVFSSVRLVRTLSKMKIVAYLFCHQELIKPLLFLFLFAYAIWGFIFRDTSML